MNALVVIRLAGEPRGKGRPRFSRATGHAFTPERTRSYEGALRYAACEAMRGKVLFDGPLSVRMRAVFAIPASMSKGKRQLATCGLLRPVKAPDADNILKVTDALNNVVWRDDKQVVEATVSKFYGDAPCLEITVSAWVASDETEFVSHEAGSDVAGAGDLGRNVGPTTPSPREAVVPA